MIRISARVFGRVVVSRGALGYRFCEKKPNFEQKQYLTDKQMQKERDSHQRPMQSSKTGNYMLAAGFLCFIFTYVYIQVQTAMIKSKAKESKKANSSTTYTGKAQIGGRWQLVDTEGKKFTSKNLLGSYYLIYFGFTHCPDICPNSLTKLSKAVKSVRESNQGQYFDLKSVFVSIDPDRDTNERIKKFVSFFDPSMIGVTGTHNMDENLRDCMKAFKIYASKIQADEELEQRAGRYNLDHTVLTYLMSDENQYITHLGASYSDKDLAKAILDSITIHQRNKLMKLNQENNTPK